MISAAKVGRPEDMRKYFVIFRNGQLRQGENFATNIRIYIEN